MTRITLQCWALLYFSYPADGFNVLPYTDFCFSLLKMFVCVFYYQWFILKNFKGTTPSLCQI